MPDVWLLTERRYERAGVEQVPEWYLANILEEDRLLCAALATHGLSAERVDWARRGVDWAAARCALLRTTWDYFERYAEFCAWLERAAAAALLINSAPLVRWNADKHYLADLAARGVPTLPTRFLGAGAAVELAAVVEQPGWERVVVKPAVSGAARHTFVVDAADAAEQQERLDALVAREAMLIQPFQRSVVERGEVTLVMIAGRYSHAVRKVARRGDFRVQDDFGGTLHPHRPTAAERDVAERALAACPVPPAYGRVDLVHDNDGRLAVMELELIEPELWLRRHPPAAEALAAEVARRLG